MSIDAGTHWCYSCREPVILQRQDAVCPNCKGCFIHELDDTISINTEENNQRSTFINTVSNFLTQQLFVSSNISDSNSWNPFLGFTGDMPNNVGPLEFLNRTLENGGDYFIGEGVEEFSECANLNDPNVPPPASRSSIDALPTIKISKKHVRMESTCAVCQERFESGSPVRKLPCKHLYHSDCIVPWLEQHSSCPICRLELSSQRITDGCKR